MCTYGRAVRHVGRGGRLEQILPRFMQPPARAAVQWALPFALPEVEKLYEDIDDFIVCV